MQWQKDLSNVASTYGLTEGDRRELERWFVMLEDVKARLMEDNDGQAEWLNKQTAEIVRLRAAFDACATELRILRKTYAEAVLEVERLTSLLERRKRRGITL